MLSLRLENGQIRCEKEAMDSGFAAATRRITKKATGAMRACEEGGNEDAQESCRCTQFLGALHARYL